MALDEQHEMTASHTPAAGPGPLLRAQREAAGHSLDDVVRDTRISRSKLAALEAEEYAKVGSDTFVMGYIRQYAKWLGTDGDALVREYERYIGRESRESQPVQTAAKTSGTGGQRGLPLVWLVVLVVAGWLLAAWLLNGREQPETPDQPNDVAGTSVVETMPEPTEAELSPEQDPFAMDVPAAESSPVSPAEEPLDAASTLTDNLATEEPVGSQAAEPASVVEEAGAVAESAPIQAAAEDELTMTFSADCWVEVRDAAGEVLFAQLQQAGDNLHLTGQAPFNVMLGNARAVTMLVNGQLVNTDPGPNRDTMRLRRVGP